MDKEKMLKILETERLKDNVSLNNEKIKFINELMKHKREDIVKPKSKKLGFFARLKILLWGS